MFYRVYGTGMSKWLVFHGFGQDSAIFENPGPPLENATLLAFDLFYHGQSTGVTNYRTLKKDLEKAFSLFLGDQDIKDFNILTFSLGCRFGYLLSEIMTPRIQKLIMVAPEPPNGHPIFRLATATRFNRALFKLFLDHPAILNLAGRLGSFAGITNKKAAGFSRVMAEKEKKRLYQTWTSFRKLRFSEDLIAGSLAGTDVHFFLGEWDSIIRRKDLAGLMAKMPGVEIHLLPATHNNLLDKSLAELGKILPHE